MKKNLLAENYKRLFKARPSSNDASLINEAKMPKSGQKLSDYDLSDNGYLGDVEEDWFELFTDEGDVTPGSKKKFVTMANEFLKDNGLKWQVSGVVGQDDEGTITWIIK